MSLPVQHIQHSAKDDANAADASLEENNDEKCKKLPTNNSSVIGTKISIKEKYTIEESKNNIEKNISKDTATTRCKTEIIRKPIDPARLKETGLGLQIAKILHKKSQEKLQNEKLKMYAENESLKPNITVILTDSASSIGTVSMDRKISNIKTQSTVSTSCSENKVPKTLSVPKITITSPPPSENRNNNFSKFNASTNIDTIDQHQRLEDVKRILGRQILIRKLNRTVNATSTFSGSSPTPQSTLTHPPKQNTTNTTTTHYLLPPQTQMIAKRTKRDGTQPSTTSNSGKDNCNTNDNTTATPTATPNSSTSRPLIKVRKFYTVAEEKTGIGTNINLQSDVNVETPNTAPSTSLAIVESNKRFSTIRPTSIGISNTNAQIQQTMQAQKNVQYERLPIVALSISSPVHTHPAVSSPSVQLQSHPNQFSKKKIFVPKASLQSNILEKSTSLTNKQTTERNRAILSNIALTDEMRKSMTSANFSNDYNQTSLKNQNLPIVLENKLLNPDEKIDLKQLRLGQPKTKEKMSSQFFAAESSQLKTKTNSTIITKTTTTATTGTEPKTTSTSTGTSNSTTVSKMKKVRLVVSSEKLKFTSKADIAAMAKKIKLHVNKTSPHTTANTASSSLELLESSQPEIGEHFEIVKPNSSIKDNCESMDYKPESTTQQIISTAMSRKPCGVQEKTLPNVSTNLTTPKTSIAIESRSFGDPSTSETNKQFLSQKILDFCGFKNSEDISSGKEYPKTVEVVDDDDDDDDCEYEDGNANDHSQNASMPTAVDFIASLSFIGAEKIEKKIPTNEKKQVEEVGNVNIVEKEISLPKEKLSAEEKETSEEFGVQKVNAVDEVVPIPGLCEQDSQKISIGNVNDPIITPLEKDQEKGEEDMEIEVENKQELEKLCFEEKQCKNETKTLNKEQDQTNKKCALDNIECEVSIPILEKPNTKTIEIKKHPDSKTVENLQKIPPQTVTTTTTTTTPSTIPKDKPRKRLGIRNAPINLVARKKPMKTNSAPGKTGNLKTESNIEVKKEKETEMKMEREKEKGKTCDQNIAQVVNQANKQDKVKNYESMNTEKNIQLERESSAPDTLKNMKENEVVLEAKSMQNELNLLATVSVAQEPIFINETLFENNTVSKGVTPLPSVGDIIDVKAFSREKSNAEIIVKDAETGSETKNLKVQIVMLADFEKSDEKIASYIEDKLPKIVASESSEEHIESKNPKLMEYTKDDNGKAVEGPQKEGKINTDVEDSRMSAEHKSQNEIENSLDVVEMNTSQNESRINEHNLSENESQTEALTGKLDIESLELIKNPDFDLITEQKKVVEVESKNINSSKEKIDKETTSETSKIGVSNELSDHDDELVATIDEATTKIDDINSSKVPLTYSSHDDRDERIECSITENSDSNLNSSLRRRKRLLRKRRVRNFLSTSESEVGEMREETFSSPAPVTISETSSDCSNLNTKNENVHKNENENENDSESTLCSSSKQAETVFASPCEFLANSVDSRLVSNVPLKKRWDLSHRRSQDETDITDDTSPIADDDYDSDDDDNDDDDNDNDVTLVVATSAKSTTFKSQNLETEIETENKANATKASIMLEPTSAENVDDILNDTESNQPPQEPTILRKKRGRPKKQLSKSSESATPKDFFTPLTDRNKEKSFEDLKKEGFNSSNPTQVSIKNPQNKVQQIQSVPTEDEVRTFEEKREIRNRSETNNLVDGREVKGTDETPNTSMNSNKLEAFDSSSTASTNATATKKRGRPRKSNVEANRNQSAEDFKLNAQKSKRLRKPNVNHADYETNSVDVEKKAKTPEKILKSDTINSETPAKRKRGRKPKCNPITSTPVSVSCDQSEDSNDNLSLKKFKATKSNKELSENTEDQVSMFGASENSVDTIVGDVSLSQTEKSASKSIQRRKETTTSGDFNPRLLLIRRRDQLDTDEKLTVSADEAEKSGGLLQCGLCLGHTTRGKWFKHLSQHYGIGWIVDEESAIDITSRKVILARALNFIKKSGSMPLVCRLCNKSFRSHLGVIMHLENCGVPETRETCPHCGNSYTKLSMKVHLRECASQESISVGIQKKREKSGTEKTTATTVDGRLKRASLIKAEQKLKTLTRSIVEGDGEHNSEGGKAREKFESDGSDFAQANDANSDESDELSTGSGSSENENESEETSKQSAKSKKRRIILKSRSTLGIKQVYAPRRKNLPEFVQKKWKEFLDLNYSYENPLFLSAQPNFSFCHGNDETEVKKLLPMDCSMKFLPPKKLKLSELTKPLEGIEWESLKPFETTGKAALEKLIYLGAPIKLTFWIPLPPTAKTQYLIVAYRKSSSPAAFVRFNKPKEADSLLIVYKITIPHSSEDQNREIQAKVHYALLIPNNTVHCLAMLPSGGFDPKKNRLGLLAVGGVRSTIPVYALPIEPSESQTNDSTIRFLQMTPSFELVLDAENVCSGDLGEHPLIETQCLCICWSEFSGHRHIFASFSNGFVAAWNIDDILNLNFFIQNNKNYFIPLNYFSCDGKCVYGLAIHYDTKGPRWLAACCCARKLYVYDIRNISQPVLLREECAKNVMRTIDWSPVWETFFLGLCDVIQNTGRAVTVYNPVAVNFTYSNLEKSICGVSQVHFNPWSSVTAFGSDNGDLTFINTEELNIHSRKYSKCDNIAASVLALKHLDNAESDLDTETEIYPIIEKQSKKLLNCYGLVFGAISKISKDEHTAFLDLKRRPLPNFERYMRINALRWNLNHSGKNFLAVGYENGFLRLCTLDKDTF